MKSTIEITLNGEARQVPESSLQDLLKHLQIDPTQVAVERNLEIVPRSSYENATIAAGDSIELVEFVGGG